jgi:hypothetical protein
VGVTVGVGRKVTSTVVKGVGVGVVGLQADSNTTATNSTVTRAKITFLFMDVYSPPSVHIFSH